MDVEKVVMFAGVGFALLLGAFVLWGPSPKPRRKGQVAGITNFGYTCFLNSLLQALGASPTFVAWLKKQNGKRNDETFTSTLLSVLNNVNGFTEDLYGDVAPMEIITALGPLWKFTHGHQDAHELLHIMLSALQVEAQPISRTGCLSDALPAETATPSVVTDVKGSGDPLCLRSVSCNDIAKAEKSAKAIEEYDKNRNSEIAPMRSMSNVFASSYKPGMILARSSEIISNSPGEPANKTWNSLCTFPLTKAPSLSNENHPFSGLLTSQLQCTNCNWKSSVRYDKLESVSLPLPPCSTTISWKRHTLTELLSRLVTSEVIHGVQCDGCSSKCPSIKTLTFGKLPRCLCLHIPRTTWSSSGMPIKRDDSVIFNEVLVLDPFTYTELKKRSSTQVFIFI